MKQKTGICFSCCKNTRLSEEHIIPQALGGKLSARIYCEDCNSHFGNEIDSELIKNINYFGTALNIKRVRGKNQPYDVALPTNGIKLTFDGRKFKRKKPIVNIEKNGDEIKYVDVTARSESELRKICTSIKEKYNLPNEIKYFEEKHPGPTDTVTEFEFDNEKIRRCVAKIAYSLLCVKLPSGQVFSDAFDEVRNYIRFGAKSDLSSANYNHTDFMTDGIRPLHKIHINRNRRKNLVIGFVCFFGTFRYTTLLSRDFNSALDWPGLDHTIDPVTSKYIEGNPAFRAPKLDIADVISPKHSKQQVLSELSKGHEIISNYHDSHEFLKIETE